MERHFNYVYIDGNKGGLHFNYIGESKLKENLINALNEGTIKDGAYMLFISLTERRSDKYLVWNKKRGTVKFVSEKPDEKVEYKTVEGEMILQTLRFLYQTIDEPVTKIGENTYEIAVKDYVAKSFKERLCKKHKLLKKNVSIVKAHYNQWFEECQGSSMSNGVDYKTGWYSYIRISGLDELKIKIIS